MLGGHHASRGNDRAGSAQVANAIFGRVTRADPDGPIQRIISLGLFTGLTQDFETQPSWA